MYALLAVVLLVIFFLSAALKILNEYERGVVFRLGRVLGGKGPGLIILIPIIDRMTKVSLRLVALDVDPQDVITRDNVSVKVNAVIYFRVIDAVKAIIEVENYGYAISQLAQTTLRSVCGKPSWTSFWLTRKNQCQAPGDPGHAHRPLHQGRHGFTHKSICPRNAAGH
jgi:regulator of protease activity HflC (stomatin/prohibitin superfamily)